MTELDQWQKKKGYTARTFKSQYKKESTFFSVFTIHSKLDISFQDFKNQEIHMVLLVSFR